MNRDRFRFRAWNKEEKIMHYDAEDTYDDLGGNPYIEKLSFGSLLEDDRYIVEQCTGLKDEDGKLVFEGDILEVPFERFDGNGFSFDTILCCVVFYCGSLMFKTIKGEYRDFTDTDFCTENSFMAVKVVGNIHENPELLK